MKSVLLLPVVLLIAHVAWADGIRIADGPVVELLDDTRIGGIRVSDSPVVVLPDGETRMKLRWYGTVDVSMDSDTDGDGFTFSEELENGTAPTFFDVPAAGGILIADGEVTEADFGIEDKTLLLPGNLKTRVGVDSVLLDWEPSVSSRVCGYNIYRRAWNSDAFVQIDRLDPLPQYRDQVDVIQPYGYRVAGVIRHFKPGNSDPTLTETEPTDTVWADLGHVALRWKDSAGFAGEEVAVDLCVENSLSMAGGGLVVEVSYDKSVLFPVCVVPSGLTSEVSFDVAVEDGLVRLMATSGNIAAGEGTLFTFVFVAQEQGCGLTEVALSSATLHSVGGALVPAVAPTKNAFVEIAVRPQDEQSEDPLVVVPYSRGDLNGDGYLSKEDKQILAKLMNGGKKPKWTASQLKAGDYNGNGRLDQGDYQLLKEDFREKGVR